MLIDAMEIQQTPDNTTPELQHEPEEKITWNDLSGDERDAVICLNLERTVRGAAKRWCTITRKSESTFFKSVYTKVKPYYRELADTAGQEAQRILNAASIRAAHRVAELVDFPHPDVQLKASKQILDKALPKTDAGPSLNLQQNFINMQKEADKYVE